MHDRFSFTYSPNPNVALTPAWKIMKTLTDFSWLFKFDHAVIVRLGNCCLMTKEIKGQDREKGGGDVKIHTAVIGKTYEISGTPLNLTSSQLV